MRVVGLTGGIASGKSTVSAMLKEAGLHVIDSDEVAHHCQRKGGWAYRRVVREFGTDVLDARGEIDRQVLGELVFRDEGARRRLNAATHTPIALELAWRVFLAWLACRQLAVVDMPLLYETGASRLTSPNVVVTVPYEMQVRRLMERDGSGRAAAEARVQSQAALAVKATRADVVVDNSGSREKTREEVQVLVQWLHTKNNTLLARVAWLAASPVGVGAAIAVLALLLRGG